MKFTALDDLCNFINYTYENYVYFIFKFNHDNSEITMNGLDELNNICNLNVKFMFEDMSFNFQTYDTTLIIHVSDNN